MWLARSRDGGRTWEAAAPVYAPPPDPHQFDNQWAPAVAAGGGRVAVAWVDFRDESWDVYLAVSRDGGRTFSSPRRVDDARGPYERLHTDPVLALLPPGSPQAGPPALAAAWTDLRDRRPDTDVRWAVSRDGGSTWDARGPVHPGDPSPVESGTVAPANQWAPSLAVDRRGRLWVAWQQLDKGTGRNRVMVRRLGSRGWGGEGDDPGPPLAVNPSHGGNQWRPRLAAGSDGRLAVVWEEDGTGSSRGWRLRAALIDTDRDRVGPATTVDPSGPAWAHQQRASAAWTAAGLVVAWQDDRSGTLRVHVTVGWPEGARLRFAPPAVVPSGRAPVRPATGTAAGGMAPQEAGSSAGDGGRPDLGPALEPALVTWADPGSSRAVWVGIAWQGPTTAGGSGVWFTRFRLTGVLHPPSAGPHRCNEGTSRVNRQPTVPGEDPAGRRRPPGC